MSWQPNLAIGRHRAYDKKPRTSAPARQPATVPPVDGLDPEGYELRSGSRPALPLKA